MSSQDFLPELTTEALVALAAASGVPPSPLSLAQLGLEIPGDADPAELLRIIDRGARTLKSIQDFAPQDEASSIELNRCIAGLGGAHSFTLFTRSDDSETRVVYLGDIEVIDVVTSYGNHRLRIGQKLIEEELGAFFGNCTSPDDLQLESRLGRFAKDAAAVEGEHPMISRLASDDAIDHMVTVCVTAEPTYEIIKWRSIDGRLFSVTTEKDMVSFASTNSDKAADEVKSALQQAGIPSDGAQTDV